MARKTIKATTRDTVAEAKPNPMTSIPVPHDQTKTYIGNSLFSSVVFVADAEGRYTYYRAKKDVPADIPISNREYWTTLSTASRMAIHEAFISMLMADQAFVNSLKTKILTAENIAALNITTGNLTVTKGAKIGPFEVDDHNTLTAKSFDLGGEEVSKMMLNDQGAYFHASQRYVGVGTYTVGAYTGYRSLLTIQDSTGKQGNVGMLLRVLGQDSDDVALDVIGGSNWLLGKKDKWCMPGLLCVLEYKMYSNWSSTCVRVWGDGLSRFNFRSDGDNHFIVVGNLNMDTRPYFVNAIAVGASTDGNEWGLTPQIEWSDGNGFGISFWDRSGNKRWPSKAWFFIYGTPQSSPI